MELQRGLGRGFGFGFVVAALAALALLGARPSPAAADDVSTARLTIDAYTCSAGYDGPDYFEDCGDNPREGADLAYLVSAPDADLIEFTTEAGGSASIDLPAPTLGGGVQVDLPSGTLGYIADCATLQGAGAVDIRYTALGFALSGLQPGDLVACDLYYIPVPLATAGGDDDDDGGVVGSVTALPSTGAGATGEIRASNLLAGVLLAITTIGAALIARRRMTVQ